ncbi:hypothetical protein T484DRAFT_1577591, partial [Baffinella frigidus]
YKTRVCAYFQTTGACHFGERCNFAHGSEDLRTVAEPDVFKTRLCSTFLEKGSCWYGAACSFAH